MSERRAVGEYPDSTYRILEVEECARMECQETHLAGRRCPVDEHEREALATVRMVELVREHDVSRRVLGELCARSIRLVERMREGCGRTI